MGPLGLARRRRPDPAGAVAMSVLPSVGLVVTCRCFVFQCAVGAFVIVEMKIARKSRMQLVPVGVFAQIDVLVLHRPPESFDEHVVGYPASAPLPCVLRFRFRCAPSSFQSRFRRFIPVPIVFQPVQQKTFGLSDAGSVSNIVGGDPELFIHGA